MAIGRDFSAKGSKMKPKSPPGMIVSSYSLADWGAMAFGTSVSATPPKQKPMTTRVDVDVDITEYVSKLVSSGDQIVIDGNLETIDSVHIGGHIEIFRAHIASGSTPFETARNLCGHPIFYRGGYEGFGWDQIAKMIGDEEKIHVTATADHSLVARYEEIKKENERENAPMEIDVKKLDRVVMDAGDKGEIVSVLKQYEKKDIIFDDWGLGDVIEYGRGCVFLFHGIPGTGKTYLGRQIAEAMGRKLRIVTTGELQSSEPGAFQRAISALFGSKKKEVLLIDECDSLIQDRAGMGQIMSAENNALLTEIEQYEGVVILTTNRVDSLDKALERRISLIVEFPHPTQEQRLDILQRIIPEKMPIAKDVDLEELATHYMTGGQIKNAVLNAARFAVARGGDKEKMEVTREDFLKAIERVMQGKKAFAKKRKTGRHQQLEVGRSGRIEKAKAEPKVEKVNAPKKAKTKKRAS